VCMYIYHIVMYCSYVCVCLYVCVYLYISYIYTYIHTYVQHTYTHPHTNINIHIKVHAYAHIIADAGPQDADFERMSHFTDANTGTDTVYIDAVSPHNLCGELSGLFCKRAL